LEEVTAARTQVLPNLTRLDPSDSCARLPVSKEYSVPLWTNWLVSS